MIIAKECRNAPARPPHDPRRPDTDDAPLLTADEEKELARRAAVGDLAARDRMIQANLRLVVNIARRYAGRGVPPEDLVAEGTVGLLRAVAGFNPELGYRFSTYAVWLVRRSIRDALHPPGRVARLPLRAAILAARWRRTAAELHAAHGRPPAPDEVAGRLGLSRAQSLAAQSALRVCCPVVASSAHTDGRDWLAEAVADGRSTAPDARFCGAEQVREVTASLGRLGEREASVLRLRFGLDGEGPRTLQEIGERLGCTRERVRQIEKDALAKLREYVQAA